MIISQTIRKSPPNGLNDAWQNQQDLNQIPQDLSNYIGYALLHFPYTHSLLKSVVKEVQQLSPQLTSPLLTPDVDIYTGDNSKNINAHYKQYQKFIELVRKAVYTLKPKLHKLHSEKSTLDSFPLDEIMNTLSYIEKSNSKLYYRENLEELKKILEQVRVQYTKFKPESNIIKFFDSVISKSSRQNGENMKFDFFRTSLIYPVFTSLSELTQSMQQFLDIAFDQGLYLHTYKVTCNSITGYSDIKLIMYCTPYGESLPIYSEVQVQTKEFYVQKKIEESLLIQEKKKDICTKIKSIVESLNLPFEIKVSNSTVQDFIHTLLNYDEDINKVYNHGKVLKKLSEFVISLYHQDNSSSIQRLVFALQKLTPDTTHTETIQSNIMIKEKSFAVFRIFQLLKKYMQVSQTGYDIFMKAQPIVTPQTKPTVIAFLKKYKEQSNKRPKKV